MSEFAYAGTTAQSIDILIQNSSSTVGAGLAGLVFNSAGLVASYRKGATGLRVAITLATQTVGGVFSSGGFVEIDATNMAGVYRLDLPNAAVDTEGFVTLFLYGATNMLPVALRIDCRALPVDIKKLLGTAYLTPTTPGTPDVNTKTITAGAITAASIAANAINDSKVDPDVTIASVTGAVGSVTGAVGSVAAAITLPTIPTGWITANGIAANAINDSKVDPDVTIASVTGAVGSVTGAVGSVASAITLPTIPADWITANGIATDAIGSSELAASAVAKILTTQMTESYAADNVAPTLAQALMLIQQSITEFSITSTTTTIKKIDGTTTAATLTLNSATVPTSVTRAT